MLDKSGRSSIYVNLACSVLTAYIAGKRATDSIHFSKDIHIATVIYDILKAILFFILPIEALAKDYLTLTSLCFIVAFCVTAAVTIIMI